MSETIVVDKKGEPVKDNIEDLMNNHMMGNCDHEFIHVMRKGFFVEVLEIYCKKCGWRR